MIKISSHNLNKKTNQYNNNFTGIQRLLPNKNYPKKDIRLIVLDIDGTIADGRSFNVYEGVKEAVNLATSKGIKVVLNTGRDYKDALKIAQELNLDTPIICNYGKYIVKTAGADKSIWENPNSRIDLKGDALEHLAQEWGFNKKNIMTIGNDVEDVSMFRQSGTAILIDRGRDSDDIRQFANYLVSEKSGVVLAIKKLAL